MQFKLEQAANLILNANSFIITTHVLPDGDGLGAEIALYYYLKELGKNVRIVNPDSLPQRYKFLDPSNVIETIDVSKKDYGVGEIDVAIILDTSDPRRINGLWDIFTKTAKSILIMDHHPNLAPHLNVSDKAQVCFLVDTASSSIGELLYRLFHYSHSILQNIPFFKFSQQVALGLYVSIITDTNSFRYARTTSLSHRIAAELIDYGLQPEEIYQNVYSTKSVEHVRLIGEVLASTHTTENRKIAWVEISKDLRKKYGATSDDVMSIVNFLLLIKEAEILILIREEDDGRKRVSLKSKGRVLVNHIANEYGGGGHDFASGYSFFGDTKKHLDELLHKCQLAIESNL